MNKIKLETEEMKWKRLFEERKERITPKFAKENLK